MQVYELTDWGLEAEPILLALGKWAIRSPAHDPTLPLSPVALMLSFRAKFDPLAARGLNLSIGFNFGEETFRVTVSDSRLSTERGPLGQVAMRVEGSPEAVAGLVYGKVPLKDLEAAGALSVDGDRNVLQAFGDHYRMPPKAEAPGLASAGAG